MFTSPQECRTIRDLLAGHALNALAPDEASTVGSHLATCHACRDEHDCLAAVAGHLSLLRDALAFDTARRQQTGVPGRTECRHVSRVRPRRRTRARAALAGQLTLSQWVSRLAYVR
ncbi:zf-HC2 domain-containing protein [Streptomyces sp. NPDC002004]